MESNGANAAPTIDEAVERTASPRQPNPVPSLRSISDPQPAIPSPQPLASINAARRPGGAMPPPSSTAIRNGALPKDVAARLQAFHASRQAAPQQFTPNLNLPGFTGSPSAIGGSNIRARPAPPPNWSSAPAIGRPTQSLGARRGLKLPGGLPGASPITDSSNPVVGAKSDNNMFNKYAEYVDTKTGALKFAGKAIIHSKGVEFSSGGSFSISLQDVDIQDELGKGNYGTVYKVVHRKIRVPKAVPEPDDNTVERPQLPETEPIVMAMKQIRLELEDSKFAQIVMELDVLHKCTSPFIIDFYGAFFQEGAVYMCIEYMDGGSVDKIYHGGVPERVLRKIAHAVTKGLLCLKEDHNIIHRDVKPTNILVNTKGEVKLCDFGVSGNLVASIAKTNIGCQSYMAPERIASGGFQAAMMGNTNGTYSVQSDIWSLGLSLLECALGRYPYPPETYNTIFSQLSAIVDGEPPDLPEDRSTPEARDFVKGCLQKVPGLRPTYANLLRHPWISELSRPASIPEGDENATENPGVPGKKPDVYDEEVAQWVISALERRRNGDHIVEPPKPALHAAPLDAVSPSPEKKVNPNESEPLEQKLSAVDLGAD